MTSPSLRSRLGTVLAGLVALVVGGQAEAAAPATVVSSTTHQGQVLPLTIRTHKLDTGLTVALVPLDSPGLVAFYTGMRVGSRDEVEPGHSGFAHLFEHMMFRGTRKMPGDVYDDRVQSLGADSTAWTWDDQTVYTFTVSRAALPQVIAMEAERFQNLYYAEREFKTEAGAVLGEYNKSYSDPSNQLQEDLQELAFDRATYKHTTMGFLRDIKAMPEMFEYSQRFFQRHYAPSKAVIFVVGDFDEAEVMTHITREYGLWRRPGEPVAPPIEPPQTAERRKHRSWKNPTLPLIQIGYKAPAYDNTKRDFAALTVLGEMLLGRTSRLHRKLVLEEQTAEKLEFLDWPHRDPFLWIAQARLKKPAFDAVIAGLESDLAEVGAGKTPEARLKAVKAHTEYAFVLGLESPAQTANQLVFYATLDGDPASADKLLQQVRAVTVDDLARVTRTYLTPAQRTVVTLSHEAAGAKAPTGGTP